MQNKSLRTAGMLHAVRDRLRLGAAISSRESRIEPGLHTLQLPGARDVLLFMPEADRDSPLPLMVSLHGAGGKAQHGIDLLRSRAESDRFALLAPGSRGNSWDMIISRGNFGPDVEALDQALDYVLARVRIAPSELAISGFSDGASYALSIGLTNGDLFQTIAAFSPGFMAPMRLNGKPRVFVSHGTLDAVLPVESCGRKVAQQLRRAGYQLDYREFNGPHTVPEEMRAEAVKFWLDAS